MNDDKLKEESFNNFLEGIEEILEELKNKKDENVITDKSKETKIISLTKENINSLSIVDLYCKIIEINSCQYELCDFDGKELMKKLNEPEKVVYLTSNFLYEYENGGLFQFFTNSSGKLSKETIEIYNLIGADNIASIIYDAAQLLNKYSLDKENFSNKMNEVSDGFGIFRQYDLVDNKVFFDEFQLIENRLDEIYYEENETDKKVSDLIDSYLENNRHNLIEKEFTVIE